jgi:hypothetical protein
VWAFTSPAEVASDLPLVCLSYLFVTVTLNLQVPSQWMLLVPFYAVAHVLVTPPLGAIKYFEPERPPVAPVGY